jgi:hypothetical protein
MTRLIVGLMIVLVSASILPAQEQYYTTLSTIISKSVAMGGATTAMAGDPLSMGPNPASLRLFPLPGSPHAVAIINPVGFYALKSAVNDSQDFAEQISNGARLVIRFIGVTYQFFDLGIRFSDEIFSENDQDYFPEKNVLAFHTNTVLMRIKLHPLVSLGWEAIGYTHYDKIDQFGYSYGVLIKPGSKVDVGVSYLDNPSHYQNVTHPLERLTNETINIGLAFKLSPGTQVSFDLRNITDENQPAFLEPHFGVEQIINRHIALRGGGFVFTDSNRKMLSTGIGLLDWNYLFRWSRRFIVPNYAVQYGAAFEFTNHLDRVWHSLTCCLRF